MNVSVESTSKFGRVVVASKDFEPGDLIFEEQPLIEWRSYEEYLLKFLTSSDSIQGQILDMYHPPLETEIPSFSALRVLSSALSRKKQLAELSENKIYKLLLTSAINAHAYFGFRPAMQEVPNAKAGTTPSSALFFLGSKLAHSCNPNVLNSSKQGPFMSFVCIRKISKGDILFASYILDLFSTPRHERREMLMETKFFRCSCDRCSGVDDVRGFLCSAGDCPGVALLSDSEPDSCGKWVCQQCGCDYPQDRLLPKLQLEKRLLLELASLEAGMKAGASPRRGPLEIEALAAKAAAELSPTHYLVVRACKLLSTWHASQVEAVTRATLATGRASVPAPWGGKLTPQGLKRDAAAAAARAIALRECVAAGRGACLGGRCAGRHPALWDGSLSTDVLWAIRDWEEAGGAADLGAARRMAGRYLPLLALAYGPGDGDVLRAQGLLAAGDPRAVAPGPPAAQGAPAAGRCGNAACGRAGGQAGAGLKRCGRCLSAYYCSAACQRAHWGAGHKEECRPGGQLQPQ
jgi:hypothetical protein